MIRLLCHAALPMREVEGGAAVTRQDNEEQISKSLSENIMRDCIVFAA
jgi:hypothetical protein